MDKLIFDYLNALCAPIRSRETRLAARAEFSGHIAATVEELCERGIGEEEAVRRAVERMGDPASVGGQIASLDRSWTNGLMVLSGIICMALAFFFLTPFVPLEYLWDFRAGTFVLLLTAALVLLGGVHRFTRRTFLDRSRVSALYAGGIGTIVGTINALGNIGDYAALGPAIAFCITSLLYGVFVSATADSLAYLIRPIGSEEIQKILQMKTDEFCL